MPQIVIYPGHGLRLAGQVEQQAPEYLMVGIPDKALGQGQRNAGIAFHDIAVIQDDGRGCPVNRCDGAGLEKIYIVVLYGEFYVEIFIRILLEASGYILIETPIQVLAKAFFRISVHILIEASA